MKKSIGNLMGMHGRLVGSRYLPISCIHTRYLSNGRDRFRPKQK